MKGGKGMKKGDNGGLWGSWTKERGLARELRERALE